MLKHHRLVGVGRERFGPALPRVAVGPLLVSSWLFLRHLVWKMGIALTQWGNMEVWEQIVQSPEHHF